MSAQRLAEVAPAQERGRPLHRVLLVVSVVAIAVQFAFAGRLGTTKLEAITQWESYRTQAGGYSLEAPAGWRRWEQGGAMGFKTHIAHSANNRVDVSRAMMPPGADVALGRPEARERTMRSLHSGRLKKLLGEKPEFREGEMQITTVNQREAAVSEFGLRLRGRKVVGRAITVFTPDNLYHLDCYADQQNQQVVFQAFDRMVASFKIEG